MKKLTFVLMSTIMVFQACVTRQPSVSTARVIDEDADGNVKLLVTGFGHNLGQMEKDACEKAINILLFEGVPSSNIQSAKLPLISNKDLMLTNPTLKAFYSKQTYKNYITSVERLSYLKQRTSQGGRMLNFYISINKISLRRYLESQNLIRKFGY